MLVGCSVKLSCFLRVMSVRSKKEQISYKEQHSIVSQDTPSDTFFQPFHILNKGSLSQLKVHLKRILFVRVGWGSEWKTRRMITAKER